jgi:hypothetical protein
MLLATPQMQKYLLTQFVRCKQHHLAVFQWVAENPS